MGFWDIFKLKVNKRKQSTVDLKSQLTIKKIVEPQDLDFDKVVSKYLSSCQGSCPVEYDFFTYTKAEFNCMLNNLNYIKFDLSDDRVLRNKMIFFNYHKPNNIIASTPLNAVRNFIAIDVETTDLNTSGNDIIELSAIKFTNFRPTDIFATLLKPRKSITPEITQITGITNDMVEKAPKFSQILKPLNDFINKYPLVMHNAKFDLKFLHVSGMDIDFEKTKIYDTLELSQKYVRDYCGERLESYRLANVCEEFSIYMDGAHRASADALATGLLFNEIVKIKKDITDLN